MPRPTALELPGFSPVKSCLELTPLEELAHSRVQPRDPSNLVMFKGASGKLDPSWGQLQWTDLTMATHLVGARALCSEAVFQGQCNTCAHPVPISPHLLQYFYCPKDVQTLGIFSSFVFAMFTVPSPSTSPSAKWQGPG